MRAYFMIRDFIVAWFALMGVLYVFQMLTGASFQGV